ncbi:proteoglycan 4 isoform X2 [Pyrgilauda ruficollis]|uniref:proteoglycan 4 isoform X2 n=1 Tax=Pyrgilauda ruficollis TaxID=221976 RepID=UPI001B88007F|nr:proteoglycan 4 isoform X2 [Pyrgilauda ruficollis]
MMSYLKVMIIWNILCLSLVVLSLSLIPEVSSQAASCEGRCFEAFERGRECDCDADCERYGKCCPDYVKYCKEAHTEKPTPETPPDNKSTSKRSSTDEEESPEEALEDPEIQVTTPAPATEEPATEADPPTPGTEDVTPDATEEPLTEMDPTDLPPTQDPTPDATEAAATDSEPPTSPTPEETTPEEPTTPAPEETTPEEPTTPAPEETTPEEPTTPAPEETTPEEPTTPAPEETTPEEPTTPAPEETTPPPEESTTPKPEETTPEEPTTPKSEEPTTPKPEEITPEEPTTPAPQETTPEEQTAPKPEEPTTPKPEETTPEEPTNPKPEEPTPEEPTTPKPEDLTPEEPTTPKPEETTPEELTTPKPKEPTPEEPTTLADSPTTPKPEKTTPEEPTTKADSPATTPKAEETTPEETTKADSPTTPKAEDADSPTIPAAPEASKATASPGSAEPTTVGKDSPTAGAGTMLSDTTVENKETTTPKKDRTTLLKDIFTAATGKDTVTVAMVTTAKPGDSPKGMDDLPNTAPTAEEPVTAAAESETTSTDTKTATTAATAPLPNPTVLVTTIKEDSTPQPGEAVTPNEEETTTDTEQAGPAADKESPGAACVIVEMTPGKKEVTTIKEMGTTPEKEMEDVTEKAPGIAKEEVTTVPKETTTRDKKDTIEEMYLVFNGTSKPTIHFQEVTEATEEPHPTEPETLPAKEEPEINKPLIQVGDLPMFPGETQEKNDEKDLCSGKPADGMVALPNGTLAVFRGHYYWLLNGRTPPTTNPRRISDGWGIPSPIDSVFSRCNCDGKTFFIKGPLYWRFTNGVMDNGYPKPLATGFAGLSGRIVATLPVARYNSRPESVYFIKRDGNMQQYVYRQEPAKKCQRRARVTIRYPAFVPRVVIRRRFQRAVRMPTVIRTVRINSHPSGVLRKEIQMTTYWRGLPKVVHSTLSVPNQNKPDGYDYYAFSYNRYYSLDVGKRIARPVTALTGKTVTKDWYNCPSK